MDKTPENRLTIKSRVSAATVGKTLKQSALPVANSNKFEVSESSTSIVSSICTPKRITRSYFAKITHKDTAPLPMLKKNREKKVKISLAVENSENKALNDRKSTKLLSEDSVQDNKYDSLPTGKNKIDTEASAKSPVQLAVQSIDKKSQRSESTIAIENHQSQLNRTYEKESDDQEENVQEVSVKGRSNQESNAKNPIGSPLANFLEAEVENDNPLNDATFEADDQGDIPAKKKMFSPKPTSSQTPLKLKRLQSKTPIKKSTQKPISMVKKVKIAEVAENLMEVMNEADSLVLEGGRGEQVFRFGGTQKIHGFNFNSKGTKIPTYNFKELKRRKENEEQFSRSLTKSQVKSIPNFKAIHERIFEKDLPIDEIENHKIKRAKLIKSGLKLSKEENIFKPTQQKSKRKLEMHMVQPIIEQNKPLTSINVNVNSRAKLNAEQREERRKMMFKQGRVGHPKKNIGEKVLIKGVRTNRRFDLMMEQRFK